jgi:hypothetical protein
MRPRRSVIILFILSAGLSGLSSMTRAQAPGPSRVLSGLPPDGLDTASVLVFREQKALDAHYFLADETVLGLDGRAEAAFARYRTDAGESLLLVVAYPSEEQARRVYERFGPHFFSGKFDPDKPRFIERIETGDYAAVALARLVLIVVMEAPDRASCEDLLRRAEARASGLSAP